MAQGRLITGQSNIQYIQGAGEVVRYKMVITILYLTMNIIRTTTTNSFIIRVTNTITISITNPKK